RFSQGEPSHRISDYFGAYPDEDLPDGLYNVPPTETIRVVVQRDERPKMLALAGIWSPIHGQEPTAAIMTTVPNKLLASVHHRMPVILEQDAFETWLDPDADLGHVRSLLRPAPEEGLRMWPVGTAVNRVASDGPELLAPIDLAPTLGLGPEPVRAR
ncbi:MAG: SOS response-associated peptidase, partial [Candidatus Limnocylindria bacterium]